MDLNKVQLIGNITQDIELKQTPNWQLVTNFSIATNRSWTDNNQQKQEQVEFHNIVLWWKLAEIASNFLKKWDKTYIEWRLQTKVYEDKTWVKKYKTEIIWENLIMLWWKKETIKKVDIFEESDKKHFTKQEKISIEDAPF